MSDFYITITDPERSKEFEEVLGTSTLPVKSLTPVKDASGRVFYIVDDKQLTDQQFRNLVGHLAEKFEAATGEVALELRMNGFPVLASGCSIMVKNPQRWM